ncbi:hypothetical protein FLLO111716_11600 [Flavobacterium longum]|uniref:RCC1 domain-containing protein n=1 Tax=Flavobacterium longum TaxID=1299340 RepID=UPI0039EAD0E8
MKTNYTILLLTFMLLLIGCSSSDDAPQPEPLYWQKITTGQRHALALRSDGTLWAWGWNAFGQLGDGTEIDRVSPVQVGTDNDWKDIYAGSYHSMAIKTNGMLWGWGNNNGLQVGNNSNADQPTPVQIGNATWENLALGDLFSIGLQTNGTLWGWGANFWGMLGLGEEIDGCAVPTQIGTANDWIDIGVGSHHTLAKKANGNLWGWGFNIEGPLLSMPYDFVYEPIQVTSAAMHNWKMLAGGTHSIAMKTNGKIYGWGTNIWGEIGSSDIDEVRVPMMQIGNDTWTMIDAAVYVSAGIKSDGTLWIWGSNQQGQLGLLGQDYYTVPTQLLPGNNWVAVSVGDAHGLALNADHELWGWGHPGPMINAPGQTTPVLIPCPQ